MNANQLADELDDIDAYEKHQTLLGKSAEMLRQQADRLAEVEKDPPILIQIIDSLKAVLSKDAALMRLQEAEIYALRDQIKHLETQVYGGTTK